MRITLLLISRGLQCISFIHPLILSKKFKLSPILAATQPFLQVISDVDDTLKSSGGVNVAGIALGGIDTQFERGEFYPGVFQFMLELSRYNISPESSPPKVAILTARAEEFKTALELKNDSKIAQAFRRTGEEYGYYDWGIGPVLYGSVAEWIIQDRKGLRKFNNFERLIQQDPTGTIMQYLYVGDTGEKDQEAGETMLREYPQIVKSVFLHVISDEPDPLIPPPKLINGRPLVFFRTYVGAASYAAMLGLMEKEAVSRVIQAAEIALKNVSRTSSKWLELDRDVNLASLL